ncbi:MAG: LUD domain-containing protein [Halanaeroarchaeum sp.]
MDTVVSTFAQSLADHDVDVEAVTAEDAPAAIDDRLAAPVVGAPLDPVGLSLSDLSTPVETDPTTEELLDAATGLTPAVSAVASYGSVVLQGTRDGEEPLSLYPETHLAVVAQSAIREDMSDAVADVASEIRSGNRSHVLATGPSATADMGALVQGAHGPKSVDVVVVTDR